MEIYTTSFCFPRVASLSATSHDSTVLDPYTSFYHGSSSDTKDVQKLILASMQKFGCQIHFTNTEVGQGRWNFQITGTYQQVLMARGMIMRECPVQHRASVKVPICDICETSLPTPNVKFEARRRLDEIADQTYTRITVVSDDPTVCYPTSTRISPEGDWSGLTAEKLCELSISGQSIDAVNLARVRLLVMLDEISGLHSEACEIDHKLHTVIAGRRRAMIQSFQEETATNIYLPSPLQNIYKEDRDELGSVSGKISDEYGKNEIWITGEFFGVQRARDMLQKLSVLKITNKDIISKEIAILPRKIDWMLTDRTDDLKSIMDDNATYIHFPPVGSSTSLITIYGDSKANIQRAIRSLMHLACQYFVGSLWLLPTQYHVLLPSSNLNPAQVVAITRQISVNTGAEVVFKSMCFEMHGLEHEVRAAITVALEIDIIKSFHHEIRFQIELANEHREFISGKKNGKINKIMQTANVKIKFETFNDHNFLINLAGSDANALRGLSLLQEELPAEISFHVPEAYHKRIIGVGGKSIQKIMKKYGVYVKFSNAEEFAALGGYIDNEDNVVARTPAKNALNLEHLKQSVMELVHPKDKDYTAEKVTIPRKYHRSLLGEKSIFIHDIESKTSSSIRFPDKETASDVVIIFGPESQVHVAAAMLLDHVPFEAEMSVPSHHELVRLCASNDFISFSESLKHDYQVTIVPPLDLSAEKSSPLRGKRIFKFVCQRSSSDFLATARESFERFLALHNIFTYPVTGTHKRADSFTEAFPHFDSKVLSAAQSLDMTSSVRAADRLMDRKLRLASSSPDVKALFNNPPPYTYTVESEKPLDVSPSFDFESSTDYGSTDYWTPLPQIGANNSIARTRQAEDAFKRGSDSLLESKLKDRLNKPRTLQNRAQSLDLTLSLTKITEASNRPPDSPTNSTGDDGGSSPTSVTAPAPSFPSVYGYTYPVRSRVSSGSSLAASSRNAQALDDPSVEEVSRVISNLGL